ncbi:Alpha/beta fold hydrolase [Sulfidibacter corallicola]|uniref:Alpha/beta fold hydrolase n=1 Tax=Sulfidibacter corallicola TaxID=2818388 RepID=A0A8A4TIN2_SULCO|nr:alpha/beta fold hydrolase [Sulfidibacter corallicola]QTD49357.1 alpha/beta fold hydrolase [Sulfidibacter corallicola]
MAQQVSIASAVPDTSSPIRQVPKSALNPRIVPLSDEEVASMKDSAFTYAGPMAPPWMRATLGFAGKLAPRTLAPLVSRLWFTPGKAARPAREQAWLEAAQRRETLVWRDGTVQLYGWGGTGPLVLLVHGWQGRGTQMAAFAEPLVEAGFRVLAFDAPAHGDSAGKQTHGEAFARVIETIQRQEGPFHAMIAHSFGCAPATYALRCGVSIEKLVLLAPARGLEFAIRSFQVGLGVPEPVVPHWKRIAEAKVGQVGDIWRAMSVTANLEAMNPDGLVVHDRDDHWVSVREGRAVASSWENGTYWETSGLGHHRVLRDPEIVARVTDFLKGGGASEA